MAIYVDNLFIFKFYKKKFNNFKWAFKIKFHMFDLGLVLLD